MSYERKAQKLDLQSKQLANQKAQRELNDPTAQMAGFVNLLNALQNPMIAQNQFGQEMSLKQQQLEQQNAWQLMQNALGERQVNVKEQLGQGQLDATKDYQQGMLKVERGKLKKLQEAANYQQKVQDPFRMWSDMMQMMLNYSAATRDYKTTNPSVLGKMPPPASTGMPAGWEQFYMPPPTTNQSLPIGGFPFPL